MKKRIGIIIIGFITSISAISLTAFGMNSINIEDQYNSLQVSNFIEDIGFNDETIVIEPKLSDNIELYFRWNSEGNYKEESFIYEIPTEFYIINNTSFDLLDSQGIPIGEILISAEENNIQIHLTDPKDTLSQRNERFGEFYFNVKLNSEVWESMEQREILFNLGNTEKSLFINMVQEDVPHEDELLTLWGIYNKRIDEVEWSARVNHKSERIGEATVKLILDEESTLKAESIEIIDLIDGEHSLSDDGFEIYQKGNHVYISFSDIDTSKIIHFKTNSIENKTSIIGEFTTSDGIISETDIIMSDLTSGESLINE